MKNAELIFVPVPAMGHLVSMVELSKLLLTRCEHLAITVLVMKFHTDTGVNSYTESLTRNPIPQLSLVEVPPSKSSAYMSEPANKVLTSFIESQVENVKDIVLAMSHCNSTRLAGFVIDLFCVSMIDIANEFEIPTYVFLASGAGLLGLMFHFQTLADDQNEDITEKYKDSDAELSVPSFAKPVPAKVLPSMLLDKDGGSALLLSCARKFRQIKGIIVNTFMELETYALESLAADRKIPPVYPVGPILNLTGAGHNSVETAVILNWLDEQPLSSVVFLCFGSFGSFPDDQVKEIAIALERSGHRFLWSLRPSVAKGDTKFPLGFSKLDDVLPVGFLERTAAIGKVIGWAPQVAVLSHSSVGAFVSHCGWNSTLESVWFGVPVATWPMYAEQQLNAFEMVAELGMAVDISIDYRKDFIVKNDVIVGAEDIEKKIREVMKNENESEVRKKVQEMKGKSRVAVSEKGSSYAWLGQLIKKLV